MNAEEACAIVDGWGNATFDLSSSPERGTFAEIARTLRQALVEAQRMHCLARDAGIGCEAELSATRGDLWKAEAERDAALRKLDAAMAIGNEIIEIMNEYDRQEAERGYVDTPGGLEHMGDVWRLLDRWRAALDQKAPT